MQTTKSNKGYRVEAHGAGVLSANDGRCPGTPSWIQAKGLTRESAWAQVRDYMKAAPGRYHTIKVYAPAPDGGVSSAPACWRAFAQADGTWIDAATARTVKAA